jgi:hypothetical protein
MVTNYKHNPQVPYKQYKEDQDQGIVDELKYGNVHRLNKRQK